MQLKVRNLKFDESFQDLISFFLGKEALFLLNSIFLTLSLGTHKDRFITNIFKLDVCLLYFITLNFKKD